MKMIREQMNDWGRAGVAFYFLIDFEGMKPQLWRREELPDDLFFDLNGHARLPAMPKPVNRPLEWEKFPVSKEFYANRYHRILQELLLGNSYLLNYTCVTPVRLNWDFEQLFSAIRSKYKVWLGNQFICFSPETFVQIRDGSILTYPVKGTVDASQPDARTLLMNDPKEMAEHATIVDLLRNDLGKVAKEVSVTRYREYEEIPAGDKLLGQAYSEIRGRLPGDYPSRIGDILLDLLPAGSVTGAPKDKTVQIIQAVEEGSRGYYTGVFGYFDGAEMDSCVLIRYLEGDGTYRSGGGITFQSNLEREYAEMVNKVYVPVP
jgi:para-aminobenzoate synthetase component 1